MVDVIVIKDLKKYFGKVKAVDGINIEVKKGEIFGFLGPNGAGKSTTIRCLMGFMKSKSGMVSVLGHDMLNDADAVEAKKSIGYLPGNVKLYDKWTGWEHIRFFENVRGKSSNVNELIKRLDYNPNPKFKHLSSGNKQKLGLILALMHHPKVIIMDEPTVGLDPLLQNEIYKILIEMRDMGATVFISSHNLPEVDKLCDRVAIIRDGKLVATESIKDLSNKRIYKINVRFGAKVSLAQFKLKGVSKIETTPDGLIITFSGDLGPILSAIAKNKVIGLEVTHGSLEDVFMKFYERAE